MACLAGKVAFITGAARGQGRSHAVRLAEEGADIIAVDIALDPDMAQTVKEVEALDRRIVAGQADVRHYVGLKAVLEDAVARLGRLDVVVANAAIVTCGPPAAGRSSSSAPVSRENRTSATMRRPSTASSG